MIWQRKIVWSEGMFIRPQHFQQQERYLEFFARAQTSALHGHFWGFHDLQLDPDALSLGKILIISASGIFPDGTPFHLPGQGQPPLPLNVPASCKNEIVYLACPMQRHGSPEIAFDPDDDSGTRYRADTADVQDVCTGSGTAAEIQFADLRLRLIPASEIPNGWIALGVAQVIECRQDNTAILERSYIPPTLAADLNPVLNGYTREIAGLLAQRGELLSQRLSQPGRGGVAEVADFLMLQLINRWQPPLQHYCEIPNLHPEKLYVGLLQLAGDLSTFTRDNRRPITYECYRHDDLRACFQPLMADLRRSLSMVLEQNAIQIELIERAHGIRFAVIPNVELLESCNFVLAVHADIPPETVRSYFPTQVKIGPVEKIRDLVNLHLPGVAIRGLPIAPRQIPYHAGYNYFELDTHHELWKRLNNSGGLAMHIAGEFPGLKLEFWAIRR